MLSILSIIIENFEIPARDDHRVILVYETHVTTHVMDVETLRYAPFSENTILHDKILFLAAVLQCTSSCRDLEVTESCQVPMPDRRYGAISPNKALEGEREGEEG